MTIRPASLQRPPAAAVLPGVPGSTVATRSRRRLEMTLGGLWLLDGALQFQPSMFSRSFFAEMLGMANMGLPGPLTAAEFRIQDVLTAHPVAWNAAFATLQVALGIGLLWGRAARYARPASILWALSVWTFGEGVGGMFMPGVSALNGAPGAALLYAVVAVILWPRRGVAVPPASSTAPAAGQTSAAAAGLAGARGAPWCWAALWSGLALLELGSANHAAVVPGAEMTNAAAGEPGWLASLNHHAGHLFAGRGFAFAIAAGIIQIAIGLAVLRPRWRRTALIAGMTLAILYGLFGQDFGGLLTGDATDPGTAPLFVLLALTIWPCRQPASTGPIPPEG
jgi:hypothetical protein